jgi:hypothetical protein
MVKMHIRQRKFKKCKRLITTKNGKSRNKTEMINIRMKKKEQG